MTRPRVLRRSYPPISDKALDLIKRKVLLQIELSAESLLRLEKGLAYVRKQLALQDAYYDAYDEISLEIDDLIEHARKAVEEVD